MVWKWAENSWIVRTIKTGYRKSNISQEVIGYSESDIPPTTNKETASNNAEVSITAYFEHRIYHHDRGFISKFHRNFLTMEVVCTAQSEISVSLISYIYFFLHTSYSSLIWGLNSCYGDGKHNPLKKRGGGSETCI